MSQVWVLVLGAAVGGFVQGISGFAFAMVAIAIWVWGVEPQLAAVMAVFGGWTGQVVSAIRVRRGWHVSLLWPFLLGSLVGIPLGQRLLPMLDANRFKLVLGSMLVSRSMRPLASGSAATCGQLWRTRVKPALARLLRGVRPVQPVRPPITPLKPAWASPCRTSTKRMWCRVPSRRPAQTRNQEITGESLAPARPSGA